MLNLRSTMQSTVRPNAGVSAREESSNLQTDVRRADLRSERGVPQVVRSNVGTLNCRRNEVTRGFSQRGAIHRLNIGAAEQQLGSRRKIYAGHETDKFAEQPRNIVVIALVQEPLAGGHDACTLGVRQSLRDL